MKVSITLSFVVIVYHVDVNVYIIYYSACVSKIGGYIPLRDLNFIFIEAKPR